MRIWMSHSSRFSDRMLQVGNGAVGQWGFPLLRFSTFWASASSPQLWAVPLIV